MTTLERELATEAVPTPPVDRAAWNRLHATYRECHRIAKDVLYDGGVPLTSEALVAATATVFIEASRRGLVGTVGTASREPGE